VHRPAFLVDRGLTRYEEGALGTTDFVGLDVTKLVLPRLRVDDLSLHNLSFPYLLLLFSLLLT
jgi:hypothetical protein